MKRTLWEKCSQTKYTSLKGKHTKYTHTHNKHINIYSVALVIKAMKGHTIHFLELLELKCSTLQSDSKAVK